MESSKPHEHIDKFVDMKTGRAVITKAPHDGFRWLPGHVLRRTPAEHPALLRVVIIEGDAFEWVLESDVAIERLK